MNNGNLLSFYTAAFIVVISTSLLSHAEGQTNAHLLATDPATTFTLSRDQISTETRTIKHSPFTIKIPVGWYLLAQKDIDELHQIQESVAKSAGKSLPPLACGFRLDLTKDYPRILVMVIDSGRMPDEVLRTIDNEEWRSGIKHGTITAEQYSSVLSNVRAGPSVYDSELKIIWMEISAQVENYGSMKQLTALRLTKTGYVVLAYSADQSDYIKHLSSFVTMVRSLVIDKTFEY